MVWEQTGPPRVVRQRGLWAVRVEGTEDGKRRPRQLSSHRTKKEALGALSAPVVTRSKSETVGERMRSWLRVQEPKLSPGAISQYRWAMGVCRPLHDTPLVDLTPQVCSDFYSSIEMKSASVRHVRTVLKAAIGSAVTDRTLRTNPADVPAPKAELQEERPSWTKAELAHFIHSVDGHPYEHLFRLGGLMGMRRSEYLGLVASDVEDWTNPGAGGEGSLTVRRGLVRGTETSWEFTPLKTKRSRRTLYPDPLTVVLIRLQIWKRDGFWKPGRKAGDESDVFVSTGTMEPLLPHTFDNELRRACIAAKVPVLSSHGLRHTCASLLVGSAKNHAEILAIAQQLGNTPAMLIARYVHVDNRAAQEDHRYRLPL